MKNYEKLSPQAKALWDNLQGQMVRLKELRPEDAVSLSVLSEHIERWIEAKSFIDKEGMIIVNPTTGLTRQHPAHRIEMDHAGAIRQMLKELGLTSSSRSRLSKAETEALPNPESKKAIVNENLPDGFFDALPN